VGGASAEFLLPPVGDGIPGGLDTGIDVQTRYQAIQQTRSIRRGKAKDFCLENFKAARHRCLG
jgi:hypothetical protein